MKRYMQNIRYFVCNEDYVPLHNQPAESYTKLQAISRAQHEVNEPVELFGGCPQDYTSYFHRVDDNLNRCLDLDRDI